MYASIIKPLADRVGAAILLTILSPLLLIAACIVRASLGSPVIFSQPRGGYKNEVFNVLKFRTMTEDRSSDGTLLSDDQRLTTVGKWIRRTSIDELPQLINILKGDMSFVGPRPFFAEYLSLYSADQKRRHDVRPGITGWAQVNGRNLLSWEEKFKYDLVYVDGISLMFDLKIVLMTIWNVMFGKGVSQENCATAEKFKGTTDVN